MQRIEAGQNRRQRAGSRIEDRIPNGIISNKFSLCTAGGSEDCITMGGNDQYVRGDQ